MASVHMGKHYDICIHGKALYSWHLYTQGSIACMACVYMGKHGACAICVHRESMESLGLIQPVSGVYWGLWWSCSWVRGHLCTMKPSPVNEHYRQFQSALCHKHMHSTQLWSLLWDHLKSSIPASCSSHKLVYFPNCNSHYNILPFKVKFSGLNIFKRFCSITSVWELASFIYRFTENPCTQYQPLLLSACARDPLLGPNSAYSGHSVWRGLLSDGRLSGSLTQLNVFITL